MTNATLIANDPSIISIQLDTRSQKALEALNALEVAEHGSTYVTAEDVYYLDNLGFDVRCIERTNEIFKTCMENKEHTPDLAWFCNQLHMLQNGKEKSVSECFAEMLVEDYNTLLDAELFEKIHEGLFSNVFDTRRNSNEVNKNA